MGIKDLSSREKANALIIIFGIIALIFYFYSDAIGNFAKISSPLIAFFISIAVNPIYLLLIYWLWGEYGFRGITSGILISVAFDIVSLVHAVKIPGILPIEPQLYLNMETIIFRIFPTWLQNQFGAFILYIIIPVFLLIIARNIIQKDRSFWRIWNHAK